MSVLLDGLDELRLALHDLPAELAYEAMAIVGDAAEAAAAELRTVYPGEWMSAHVYVANRSEPYIARFTVLSQTSEAGWWEYGTQNRHTQKGWNRGAAPAHKDQGLGSIAKRHRIVMKAALIALVRAAGFDVTET